MPSIRRSARVAAAVTALLALTATACGPDDSDAAAKPTAAASTSATTDTGNSAKLPKGLPTSVKDLEKWKQGDWKNWDKWARDAADFANPVIKDLWKPSRMSGAKDNENTVQTNFGSAQGTTDPAPRPVAAKEVARPYHQHAAPVGKIFFDSPDGPKVCSGTVVDDPAHPGKSNLVWTAGHCVHSGSRGGWYRNIIFVPSYNDNGLSAPRVDNSPQRNITPYGAWWADWSQTSSQWIATGTHSGGGGSPYDFAVLHVKPENGGGKSLQETVGASLPVWFGAPSPSLFSGIGAWGYPQASPYDGARMFDCIGKPGRLSMSASMPTEYRIGCTMTGGSSGGGWFATMPGGKTALVSNTSIGPANNTWLAGPHLGPEAQGVYNAISRKFARSR